MPGSGSSNQGNQNGQGFPDGSGSGLPGSDGDQAGGNGTGAQAGNGGTGQGQGSGNQTGNGSRGGGSEVAYGTGDDPFADLRTGSGGGLSNEEKIAILDARLEEGYGEFDEMIIEENERAQGGSGGTVAGSGSAGTGGVSGDGTSNGTGNSADEIGEPVILATNSGATVSGGGYLPNGTVTNTSSTGTFGSGSQEPAYDVPDDIPSGDDDDVVAQQLREAAMNEPDPELREKLWDEYRAYTGLTE